VRAPVVVRWIYHHFLSMGIATLMLTLQLDAWDAASSSASLSSALQTKFVRFFGFCIFQGAVMLVQMWYQTNRNYVRKSVGKAKQIDVDAAETIVEKPTDLKILVPLLFAVYIAELYLGIDLLYFWWVGGERARASPQLALVGVLMVVLCIGNAYTTGNVLASKRHIRRDQQQKYAPPITTVLHALLNAITDALSVCCFWLCCVVVQECSP
jgi:hypothetical protein